MDEKALLEAIRSIVREEVQAETTPIKADIQGIKTDIQDLQGDVTALKADMAHHNHTVEPQLKIIREGLDGWSERARQTDRHENKLEDHGNRILALEYAFKTK